MSKRMEEEQAGDVPRPSEGNTVTAQGERQVPRARTPNERDESADSQSADAASAHRVGRIAHDDLMEGQQDTSKSQEMDATYHRVRQDSEPTSNDKPRR